MNHGVGFMGHYEYDDAAKAFEQALALQPHLTTAQINLAIALFNRGDKDQGDLERSDELLTAVLTREPDNLRALYFKAIVLQHIGNTEAAIPLLEKVVQQAPNDGAAWYLLGLCKQRLNQPAEAELLKAVECRPYLYSAWYKLFQVAVAAKDTDKAKAYMEKFKALRESPLGESIELPQYNQMGDLALVQPLPAATALAAAQCRYRAGDPVPLTMGSGRDVSDCPGGLAAGGDFNGDGSTDLLLRAGGELKLFLQRANGGFGRVAIDTGLEVVKSAMAVAVGDVDNDQVADVFVAAGGGVCLFEGNGNGTFSDISSVLGEPGGHNLRSALFLDADHDGDLDLLATSFRVSATDQFHGVSLWQNNADGSFTNIAERAGIACPNEDVVAALPGDIDGDRDADLVILRVAAPVRVFMNELLGTYSAADSQPAMRGDRGGILQEFTGDGLPDLLLLGEGPNDLLLWAGDGAGHFDKVPGFTAEIRSLGSRGSIVEIRALDLELDGDLDIVVFTHHLDGRVRAGLITGHVLLCKGHGRFALLPDVWPEAYENLTFGSGIALMDLNGDSIADLVEAGGSRNERAAQEVRLRYGTLKPPSAGVAFTLTGIRGRDGRTRSPATGFGAKLTLRSGLHEQTRLYTGLNGGPDQSWLPEVFGLGGATNADYLHILWPDGVAQVEMDLAAGTTHKFSELQRKISSCPVLFAWNGERFGFVTDFAGVGGLGYFAAPGEYSQPQVEEHVKIEPGQLVPKDGAYELRITEPMEEVAYVDRLELLAIDHPADWSVFPDERLAITGPKPTRDLLVVRNRLFPLRATSPDGADCTENLRKIDRHYAYEPELDRRFIGFCEPHVLELDFGNQLAGLGPDERVFLFVNGFIEYPYSSTVYGASQAGVGWESIRIDASRHSKPARDPAPRTADFSRGRGTVSRASNPQTAGSSGRPADRKSTQPEVGRPSPPAGGRSNLQEAEWTTIVPDAGVPGGMARMFTVDLTGRLDSARQLRLTTNLEVCYDQIFIARVIGAVGAEQVTVRRLAPDTADFRRVGFALEYSPDGRLPLIYDYERSEPTAPFHVQRGPYTRYGPVTGLLQEFDDRYVMVGPGDEIAVRFDATRLNDPAAGMARSFILVSHAYCKDMDLYTATPETVEPLPFRGMSRYPYPASERFPDTPALREWQQAYNTRRVE